MRSGRLSPDRRPRSQRGFALVAVMLIGAMAMYLTAGMLGEDAVGERRAQELELLKLRAYWAAQGHVSYAISRGRQGPPCGGVCADQRDREDFYADAAAELHDYSANNFRGPGRGKERRWSYPEISSLYFFPVAMAAERHDADRRIRFDLQFQTNATMTHAFLARNWPVRRALEVVICPGVVDVDGACPDSEAAMAPGSGIAKIALIAAQ